MKNSINNQKNSKKIWNWLLTSVMTVFVGISLTLNIVFIPKYFAIIKEDNNSTATEITIDAVIGDPNDTANISILFKPIEYYSNFTNLGSLIKHYNNRYETKSYIGLGDLLIGVSAENNKKFIHPSANQSWFIYIYYQQQKRWILPNDGNSGMNNILLHNDDHYRLALNNWS